jgi:hypothetical protein
MSGRVVYKLTNWQREPMVTTLMLPLPASFVVGQQAMSDPLHALPIVPPITVDVVSMCFTCLASKVSLTGRERRAVATQDRSPDTAGLAATVAAGVGRLAGASVGAWGRGGWWAMWGNRWVLWWCWHVFGLVAWRSSWRGVGGVSLVIWDGRDGGVSLVIWLVIWDGRDELCTGDSLVTVPLECRCAKARTARFVARRSWGRRGKIATLVAGRGSRRGAGEDGSRKDGEDGGGLHGSGLCGACRNECGIGKRM